MPPARDPRMGRAHLEPSIEPDKRRLHEHGVNKANAGSTKKGAPAKHSFRARVECFRPSPPPPHGPPKPREPTPLPENPTEAFFKTLKRELDVRHAAGVEDGDNEVTATAPGNSSSPPLPPPNVENVTKLDSTYRGRARALETQSLKKIDEAHATILAKLDALKQSDKAWTATVREHQKWTVRPLSDINLDFGPPKGQVRLGSMAKDLHAQLEKSTAEVSKLWDDWETLDCQIKQLGKQLDDGGGDRRSSKDAKVAAEADAEIRKVISEARTELKELGDAAIEKADRAEKDIHARWKKERIKIQQNEAKAADTELFG